MGKGGGGVDTNRTRHSPTFKFWRVDLTHVLVVGRAHGGDGNDGQ